MRTVEYSNLFLDKLEVIKEHLLEEFGEKTAKKAIKKIFGESKTITTGFVDSL